MTVFVGEFVVGTFRKRPNPRARNREMSLGAVITARRFGDATRSNALRGKLAGMIFRHEHAAGFRGFAFTAKKRRLRCRDLGGFLTEEAAKRAIVDEYAKRDGNPLQQ